MLFNAVITGESSLAMARTELLRALGTKAFGGDKGDSSNWTADEALKAGDALNSGLRMFYGAYDWPFLRPWFEASLEVGTAIYDLPDDFVAPASSLAYCGQWANEKPVVQGTLHDVTVERERTQSGVPTKFAIELLAHSGESQGQRQAIHFNAVPASAYRLRSQWEINPYTLTAARPYPLGTDVLYGECLKFAVLAAWEILHEERIDGSANAQFERLLARCKEKVQRSGPRHLGVMGTKRLSRSGESPLFTGDVRYGGNSVFGG